MRLSVIIPVLNEAANVGRAIASAWTAGAYEVIVVDGGSEDETALLAAGMKCHLLHSARGRAEQQNAGARAASGDVLLFLHADNWLAAGVSEQIDAALASPARVCGALRQKIEADGAAYRLLEWGNNLRVRLLGMPYGDQAIFVRRSTFENLGGFPDVPLMEDVLLMQRLRPKSWPVRIPGTVHISPRRWKKNGIVRQTLRNWWLLARFTCGASPETLARHYSPHQPEA